VEPQEYDEIIRNLVRIAAHQGTINEDLRTSIQEQQDINQRLTLAIERIDHSIERIDRSIERIDRTLAHVDITQARMETLFARVFRPQENGPDA